MCVCVPARVHACLYMCFVCLLPVCVCALVRFWQQQLLMRMQQQQNKQQQQQEEQLKQQKQQLLLFVNADVVVVVVVPVPPHTFLININFCVMRCLSAVCECMHVCVCLCSCIRHFLFCVV